MSGPHKHVETRYNGIEFRAYCNCGVGYNGPTPDDAESALLEHIETHPVLHRMTANGACVDCGRTEADLHESGASISGFDVLYPPTPAR
jgi:hypothetical protein